jgi:hypothetical protein
VNHPIEGLIEYYENLGTNCLVKKDKQNHRISDPDCPPGKRGFIEGKRNHQEDDTGGGDVKKQHEKPTLLTCHKDQDQKKFQYYICQSGNIDRPETIPVAIIAVFP